MNEDKKIEDALRELGFQESVIPNIIKLQGQVDGSDAKVGVYGRIRIEKYYPKEDRMEVHCDQRNLITNLGFTALAQVWSLDWSATPATFHLNAKTRVPYIIAVGTGSTAPAEGNTTLATEPALARKLISTRTFSGSPVDTVLLSITFSTSELNTVVVTESGLFAADGLVGTPASGTMFSRAIVPTITKSSNFELTVRWSYTFAKPV